MNDSISIRINAVEEIQIYSIAQQDGNEYKANSDIFSPPAG